MNHFLGLLLLAVCISLVFATINKDTQRERVRYFAAMCGFMVVGSLVVSWLMSAIPW